MKIATIVTGLPLFAAAGCGSTVTESGTGEDGGQTEDRGSVTDDGGRETGDGETAVRSP